MPTFARLAAGILFAGLAYYVSLLIVPLFEPEEQIGWFREINAAVGLVIGWRVMGARAGKGMSNGIGVGLTAAVMMVLVALLIHSTVVMIFNSLNRVYDTAPDAVIGVFELMLEHGALMSTTEVWATLLGGGIVIGILTEIVARRFD